MTEPDRAAQAAAPASSLWASALGELALFARTFVKAWLLLAAATCAWITISSPPPGGASELAQALVVGFVLCMVYMFWPALITAIARLAFRLIGWGALLPLPLIALGVALSCWAFGGWLQELLSGVFAAMSGMGPCAAHVGGQSLPLALSCMTLALLHPAGLFALAKLLLALLFVLALGAGPGLALAIALIARALTRARRARAS